MAQHPLPQPFGGPSRRPLCFSLWVIVSLTIIAPARGAESVGRVPLPPTPGDDFLRSHCVDCHSGRDAEAGLDLEALLESAQSVDEDRETVAESNADESGDVAIWVRIFDRVASGEMPPADSGELSPAESRPFLNSVGDWLREHQQAEASTLGRVRGRRLTNLQLERTLHDLLGVDIPIAVTFSDESRIGGFTTVAAGQAMSHFQIEQHLRAVDAALDEAVRRITTKPDRYEKTFLPEQIAKRRPGQRNREPELREGLAAVWSSRLIFYGRMAVTTAPTDGWYRFTIRASAIKSPEEHGVWCSVRSGPCISSAPLLQTLGGFEATETPGEWTFEGWLPKGHMLEVRPADATLPLARFNGGQVGAGEGEPQDVPGVALHSVTMTRVHRGPDDDGIRRLLLGDLAIDSANGDTANGDTANGDTGNRDKRGGDKAGRKGLQIASDDPSGDAARLIRAFASRAFRRPVSQADTEPYVRLAHQILADGQPLAVAIRAGYRGILCSPRFLYLSESPGPLDDHAIASRLSYFLWNRMPDETLRGIADRGELASPEAVREQVRRMLADPRGDDFVKDFAAQWLDLADIDFTEPDPRLYRDFDPMVQHAMLLETHHYLQKMLDEDLGIAHLIDSDFVMLNSRLARFYGVPDIEGDAVRLVEVTPEDRRGGLLTQGSVLKITANGSTTSPVIRGVWISERLLGEHIPPPPTNVPAIEPDTRGATTIREQLDLHKADASCAVCHVKIDPPGFALENYDPSGKWREKYVVRGGRARHRVDPSYEMPGGESFADIDGFKAIVLRQPERLARGLAEKLITYGTGATVRFADRDAVEEIVSRSEGSDYGFRSLVESVATSPLFLSK